MKPGEKMESVIMMKVSATMKAQMQNRAERLNLTLSEFIRQCYVEWMQTCSDEAISAKAMWQNESN